MKIVYKLQQLLFTKHFSDVTFKLQLPNFNLKRTLNLSLAGLVDTILFYMLTQRFFCDFYYAMFGSQYFQVFN